MTNSCENVFDIKSSSIQALPPSPHLAKGLSCSPLLALWVLWGQEPLGVPWGLRFSHGQALAHCLDPQGPACTRLTLVCPHPSVPPPNPLVLSVLSARGLTPLPGALCPLEPSAPRLRGCLAADRRLTAGGKEQCWESHFFTLQISLVQHFCKAGASPLGELGAGRCPRAQDNVSCLDRG